MLVCISVVLINSLDNLAFSFKGISGSHLKRKTCCFFAKSFNSSNKSLSLEGLAVPGPFRAYHKLPRPKI